MFRKLGGLSIPNPYFWICLWMGMNAPAFAEDQPNPLCFDLSQPNSRLLRPGPKTKADWGSGEYGTDEKTGFEWARVSGIVEKPVSRVLEILQDPMTTRDPKTTQVTSTLVPVKGTLQKQHIQIVVKPFFLITLEWEEDWLYTLKKGTPARPDTIVISYQKTSGTSHIQHFCGNILIQRLSRTQTGVYLTEEIKADRRSAEDVHNGLMGTLRTLQK